MVRYYPFRKRTYEKIEDITSPIQIPISLNEYPGKAADRGGKNSSVKIENVRPNRNDLNKKRYSGKTIFKILFISILIFLAIRGIEIKTQ